jgi:hypothetical protein
MACKHQQVYIFSKLHFFSTIVKIEEGVQKRSKTRSVHEKMFCLVIEHVRRLNLGACEAIVVEALSLERSPVK